MPEHDYSRVPTAVDFNQQLAMMAAQSQSGSDMISRLLPIIMAMSPAMGGRENPGAVAARLMLPADIAGTLGTPRTPMMGAGISNIVGRSMMGMAAFGAFQDIQGQGGPSLGGFGLGYGQAQGMTGFMGGLAGGGSGATQMDVAQITAGAGQGGFTRGITDVKQARQQLKTMVDTVVELSRELNMTIQEVSQGMNQVRGMGFTRPTQAAQVLRGMMGTAASTGMDLQTTMGVTAEMGRGFWQQATMRGAPIGLGAANEAARGALGTVGSASRLGFISDEQLMNTTGQGGQAGAAMFSSRLLDASASQMGSAQNKYMMAAFMDPRTGGMNQGLVNQFMSGQISLGRLQQMASQNVSQMGGLGRWLDLQPQAQGQLQAATGGMMGLGFAQAGMRQHGMDPNDPGAATVFGRISGLRNPMEAQMGLDIMGNWGAISESRQVQQRVADRQMAQGTMFSERQQASSLTGFVERTFGEQQRKASEGVERGVAWVASRAASLLSANAPGTANVGLDFGLEVSRGVLGATGRGSLAPTGVFVDPFAETSRAKGAIAALREQARSSSGQDRERLLGQARDVESQVAMSTAEVFREGGGYWGGRAGDVGLTRADLEAKTGLRQDSAQVKKYYETRESRNVLTQQFGQGYAVGGEAFLRRMVSALGPNVVSSTDQLKYMMQNQGLSDILSGVSDDRLGAVLDTFQEFTPGMKRLTKDERNASVQKLTEGIAAYKDIKRAADEGGFALSEGTANVLTDVRPGTDRAALAQRNAVMAAGQAYGEGERVVSGFQGNISSSGKLLNWLESEEGKKATGEKSLGEWMTAAGISAETQKAMFGENMPGGKTARDQTINILRSSIQASSEAYSQTLRDAGALSTSATDQMRPFLTKGDKFEQQVAAGFLDARKRLDAGDLPGALEKAEKTILDITAPTTTTSKFRELSKLIPSDTLQRMQGLLVARSRGSKGGETITQAEFADLGGDLTAALGEDMAKAVSSGRGGALAFGMKGIQDKLQKYLAQGIAAPGRAAGTQADVSAATSNPQAQMTKAVADGMTQGFGQAFPNGITINSATAPVQVEIKNASAFGIVQQRE